MSEDLNIIIGCLPHREAIFILKALRASGHVSDLTLEKAIELAESFNWAEQKYD